MVDTYIASSRCSFGGPFLGPGRQILVALFADRQSESRSGIGSTPHPNYTHIPCVNCERSLGKLHNPIKIINLPVHAK